MAENTITVEFPPPGPTTTDVSRKTIVYETRPSGGLHPLEIIERRLTTCILRPTGDLFFLEYDDGSQYLQTHRGESFEASALLKWVKVCRGVSKAKAETQS